MESTERTPHQQTVEDMVRRTCAEQGVPVKVTDPTVIRRVAALLGAPVHPSRGHEDP